MRRDARGPRRALSFPRAGGFALLEVLVGLLLLGFGALGAEAGLTAALRLQQSAGVAQAGVGLAADAGERLRAVPAASRAAESARWVREARELVSAWPGLPWQAGGAIELAPARGAGAGATWVLRLRWRDRALDPARTREARLAVGAAP